MLSDTFPLRIPDIESTEDTFALTSFAIVFPFFFIHISDGDKMAKKYNT